MSRAPDRLRLHLRPRCRVGHYAWEKELARELGVVVEFEAGCQAAGRSDRLEDAFDYEPLVTRLVEVCEGRTYDLVEALAEAVARVVVAEFGVPRVSVRATKREALPALDAVDIEIEREAADFGEPPA